MSGFKELIKSYFNSLVQEFIAPNHKDITIVFKDYIEYNSSGDTAGLTHQKSHETWLKHPDGTKVPGSERITYKYTISFLNRYKDSQEWRSVVTHEFAHLYLFAAIGDHTHDDRFYSHMEKFENWLDKKWNLPPRQDKSGDWNQHVDQSKNEERQKKDCTSCSKRAIPYTTCGKCFQCYQKQVERNQEIEKENQRIGASNQERKQEQKEFDHLDNLLRNSKDLAELEKNWQVIQNSPLYSNSKKSFEKYTDGEAFIDNKTELDKYYASRKSRFQPSQDKGNSGSSEQNEFNRLVDSLRSVKNLIQLEKIWREVKSSSVYSTDKHNWENKSLSNKEGLDGEYNDLKSRFSSSNSNTGNELRLPNKNNSYSDYSGIIYPLIIIGVFLGACVVLSLLFSRLESMRMRNKRK